MTVVWNLSRSDPAFSWLDTHTHTGQFGEVVWCEQDDVADLPFVVAWFDFVTDEQDESSFATEAEAVAFAEATVSLLDAHRFDSVLDDILGR